MSTEESGDSGPGNREVAYRLFAAEFEDADFSYAESDEERAPNYVVTPTGARVNRMFVVGVLTEVESVGEDILRARIVDPTGAVVVYAGQYQPDAQAFFERIEPPAFLAVSGKARTFQPEDSDRIYTSLRPESVNEVDAETRDRWTVRTAEQTLDRIGTMAAAKQSGASGEALTQSLLDSGVDDALAAGIPLALEHYGTTGSYLAALRTLSLGATRVVAGEREEAGQLAVSPGEGSDADIADLATIDVAAPDDAAGSDTVTEPTTTESTAEPTTTESTDEPTTTASADEPSTTESAGESSTAQSTTTEPETTDSESITESTPEESEATAPTSSATTGAEASSETEPTTESDSEPSADSGMDAETAGDEDIGDFEPGEFDLDEETREEVESEYGTDFKSGSEVDDPGEADIDTPDPEDLAEAAEEGAPAAAADAEPADDSAGAPAGSASPSPGADAVTSDASETETEATTGASASQTEATTGASASQTEATTEESDESGDPEPVEDIDLEDAVMETMEELDNGDGANRSEVIEAVVERSGADSAAVEDAVQSALMSGRCYEPDDTTLKSI